MLHLAARRAPGVMPRLDAVIGTHAGYVVDVENISQLCRKITVRPNGVKLRIGTIVFRLPDLENMPLNWIIGKLFFVFLTRLPALP